MGYPLKHAHVRSEFGRQNNNTPTLRNHRAWLLIALFHLPASSGSNVLSQGSQLILEKTHVFYLACERYLYTYISTSAVRKIKNKILISGALLMLGKYQLASIISYLRVDKNAGLSFFKAITLLMTPLHIKHVS